MLNAFRHHRHFTLGFPGDQPWRTLCSTPFGIISTFCVFRRRRRTKAGLTDAATELDRCKAAIRFIATADIDLDFYAAAWGELTDTDYSELAAERELSPFRICTANRGAAWDRLGAHASSVPRH
ncbi:MAG TPA: hypothetical protein VJX67_19035 [Blastocatellia bacterium]|nr:hypothetical protein [Blastocatellia bacterium]